jgi:hypothetical protein|tara:strand:+ start:5924 stop:6961 length:1038 start_codon:yes stop_codon:yes gene_type:complete
MTTQEEILAKANEVTTSVVGNASGGILKPAQANRFIDFVVDQSVLLQNSRVVRMRSDQMEIDKLSVGTRLMAKATEASDTGANSAVTFTKVSLTTVKLRLDWEVSTESLEDNIEGDSLEDHLAQVMARQTANDLDDLFINGDTTSSNGLLKALNGFINLATSNAYVLDNAGNTPVSRAVYDRSLRKLPSKYLQRRPDLRFFAGPQLVQDTIYHLGDPSSQQASVAGAAGSPVNSDIGGQLFTSPSGPNGGPGDTGLRPFGIPVTEVPLMPEAEAGDYSGAAGNHGYLILTFPQNHIIGIQREITVYREFQPKKDTIEYTQFTRVASAIENDDAYVLTKNIKRRDA